MENNKNNSEIFIFICVAVFGFIIITLLGYVGMFFAYIVMTKYMYNFVLSPCAKNISAKNNTPNNYILGKLKTTRMTLWLIAIILKFSIIFVFEMVAIATSMRKINEIRMKIGLPRVPFSRDAYLIYDEYWKFSKDAGYEVKTKENGYDKKRESTYDDVVDGEDVKVNVVEKYTSNNKNNLFNINVKRKKIETVAKTENIQDKEENLKKEIEEIKNELYKTVSKEPLLKDIPKFDFDKPVGEMAKIEPIKESTSSIWDKPVEINLNSSNKDTIEKTNPTEDEIRCEKCGVVISKMKIACPKCGALVKNTYRTGK